MLRSLVVATALCALRMPVLGATGHAAAPKVAWTDTCSCNYTLSTLYLAVDSKRYDRLYTTSYDELTSVVRAGYTREPDAGLVLLEQAPGAIPLYRLWNAAVSDHIYTVSTVERDNLMATSGWVYEGIAAYVMPRPACGTLPFYRMYNAYYHAHYYSVDPSELAVSVGRDGFVFESVAGYIWANDAYRG